MNHVLTDKTGSIINGVDVCQVLIVLDVALVTVDGFSRSGRYSSNFFIVISSELAKQITEFWLARFQFLICSTFDNLAVINYNHVVAFRQEIERICHQNSSCSREVTIFSLAFSPSWWWLTETPRTEIVREALPITLSKTCRATWASNALSGSSNIKIVSFFVSNDAYIARAIEIRCFWPPDKLFWFQVQTPKSSYLSCLSDLMIWIEVKSFHLLHLLTNRPKPSFTISYKNLDSSFCLVVLKLLIKNLITSKSTK